MSAMQFLLLAVVGGVAVELGLALGAILFLIIHPEETHEKS